MKKKVIKSLKICSLLGFACNNIKADYSLTLTWFTDCEYGIRVNLKGGNNTILKDPTKCTNGKLEDILKKENETKSIDLRFKTLDLRDIKKNFIPLYYKLKDSKDLILISDELKPDGAIDFNKPEDVEEVYYILNNTTTNKITFCSNTNLINIIESKKFVIDEDYIYKVILKNFNDFKDLDNVKKHFDINIGVERENTYNIEIIYYHIFKISDSVEFKISEKDVKDKDYITPLNNLKNLYINTDDLNKLFDKNEIKKEANLYIFEYNSKKYYIISDKKHNQNELFGFLKTKNNLKDKDLIFDPNSEINNEEGTGNLVPGEYKIIEKKPKEDPEPKPQTSFKYKFTGDTSLSKWIERDFVVDEKVKVQSLFDNQDTSKYVFVAIKEGTNKRFINDQIIEPGTYELKREEKPNEDNKNKEQEKGSDQGDPEKSRKNCSCC